MNFKSIFTYFWKLMLCGIAFLIGMAVNGIVLSVLGFKSPAMPEGTDANTIALWFLLGSVIMAFTLSFVSRSLQANWLVRWIILEMLIWEIGVVGMVVESFFLITTRTISSLISSLFFMFNFLLPSLFLSALVSVLFRPTQPFESFWDCLKNFFADRKTSTWTWRIVAALLAYPLVYFAFGLIVQPFIQDFYATGQFELTTPTWGQLIPLQLVRSLLFLVVSLPVIVWWRGTRRGLWLTLGVSIFVLTAFMAVITAYWFPWQMRLFHGMELFADALVYSGALVTLANLPNENTKRSRSAWATYLN